MRTRLPLLAVIVAAAFGTIGVSSASAAVEFGDSCVANEPLATPFTVFEIANPDNPMPTAAPSPGVLTKLRFNLIPVPVSLPLRFDVVRPTAPGQVQIIGEVTHTVTGGSNSFDAQIPIKVGDRIGVGAVAGEGNVECHLESDSSFIGGFLGNPGVGATTPVLELPADFRVPAVGVVEPDADNDGFGDETQDKCPQSAAVQAVCPVVSIDALSLKGKGSVTVLVAVSGPAPVAVSGTVKLGKGKQAKLKAPTKSLTPGPIGKFKLKFPGALKERLKELDPGQSLQLKITANATNVTGAISSDKLKLKLKREGQRR